MKCSSAHEHDCEFVDTVSENRLLIVAVLAFSSIRVVEYDGVADGYRGQVQYNSRVFSVLPVFNMYIYDIFLRVLSVRVVLLGYRFHPPFVPIYSALYCCVRLLASVVEEYLLDDFLLVFIYRGRIESGWPKLDLARRSRFVT